MTALLGSAPGRKPYEALAFRVQFQSRDDMNEADAQGVAELSHLVDVGRRASLPHLVDVVGPQTRSGADGSVGPAVRIDRLQQSVAPMWVRSCSTNSRAGIVRLNECALIDMNAYACILTFHEFASLRHRRISGRDRHRRVSLRAPCCP